MSLRRLCELCFVVFALVLMAQNAKANTVELLLTSGASTSGVIVGTPCGTGTCVSFSGTVGLWSINATNGTSFGPGNSTMNLSSFNATTSGAAPALDVLLSDTGFTTAGSSWTLASTGTLFSGSGTATYNAYLDNSYFGMTTLIGTLGPFTTNYNTGSQVFSGSAGPPYALTQDMTLTAGSGGAFWDTNPSSIALNVPAPEPSSMFLLGAGLLLTPFLRLKRLC